MHHVPWPKGPQIPEKWQGSALLFLLVATVLLFCAGQAQASYMERLASPVPGQSATAAATPANVSRLSQSHLIHLKGPKGTAPRLHSLGEDLPLAHALALLTPRGWLALGAHEAPMTRVSWVAQTPWLATLERIAQETNTLIILDWEEKTFTVQPYSDELYEKLTCRKVSDASSKAMPASVSSPTPASPKPANKSSASAPMPSQAQAHTYDRPDLIVSHYAGPGRVYLARDMSVVEASRVLDTKITRLMAWNNLKDKKAVLRKGTLIWLTKPTVSKQSAKSTATATNTPVKPLAKPEAKTRADARPKTQTALSPKPAPKTDQSVTQALARAQSKAKIVAQSQDKPKAHTASSVPAPAPTWSIAPGSLKAQVGSWASRAGYRMVWQADTDLHMAAGATFNGSFAEAVRALFEGLHEAGAPYTAHIFHGNNVLHIGDR